MTAIQIAMDQSFNKPFGPVQQPNRTSPPIPPPRQPNSLAKKKRNQKTRNQYKKKAKAQAQHVTVQVQEVKHLDVQISVGKPSQQVATSSRWHAVIPWVGMTSFGGMIMVQIETI